MNAARVTLRFVPLAALLLVLGWLASRSEANLLRERDLLAQEPAPFTVPAVAWGGLRLPVEGGSIETSAPLSLREQVAVLRAAYASVLNRLDPLWGMEGTDPGELRESVGELIASQRRIAATYPASDRASLDALYPTAFLSSLADAEAARQLLLAEPSPEQVQTYYGALEAALRAHAAYARDLGRVLESIDTASSSVEFNFIGGTAHPQRFLAALGTLTNAERQTHETLALRERCASHYSEECPSLRSAFVAMTQPRGAELPAPEPLPSRIAEHRHLLDAFLDARLPSSATSSVLIALSRQSCNAEPPFKYYELRPEERAGQPQFKFAYLNQLYFYDIQHGGNPYFEHLKKAGVQFLFQSINNLYMCPNIGAEYTAARTLLALRDAAAQTSTFGDEAARARLVSSPVLRDADAAAYTDSLRAELRQKGERGSDSLRMEALLALFDQQSARFDEVIRTAVTQNALAEDPTYFRPDLTSLFLSRSYFLLFLLSANPTVVPAPPNPLDSTPFDPEQFKLLTYPDIQARYSHDALIRELIRGKETEHAPAP